MSKKISWEDRYDKDGLTYLKDTDELFTGTLERCHDNGQVGVLTQYLDGRPDGLNQYFHENGQLSERSNWKDGKENGLTEKFDKEGVLTDTSMFDMGKLLEEKAFTQDDGYIKIEKPSKD